MGQNMLKINNNVGDTTVQTAGQSDAGQAPKGKSYLLRQPIQDTTSFSGKEEQQTKKSNTLA